MKYNRTRRVTFRVTEADYRDLEQDARDNGLSISNFCVGLWEAWKQAKLDRETQETIKALEEATAKIDALLEERPTTLDNLFGGCQ